MDKFGDGVLTFSGINSYEGATTVSAGTLLVNGSLTASNSVTVALGATLGGSGTRVQNDMTMGVPLRSDVALRIERKKARFSFVHCTLRELLH